MKYILLVILIIVMLKYIIFVLASIPIRFFLKRSKNRQYIKPEDNNSNLVVGYRNSKLLKKYTRRLLSGYTRYFIIQVGMIPSHTIRNFIYRKILLVNLDNYAIIYFGSEIRAPYNLEIGKGSIIGDKSILDARNGIKIGENVNLSSNVHIWTEQHDHRDPYFLCNSDSSFRVTIGDRVWIGPNVTILPRVEIGEGAVIGAGSVVTKNVEPFTIVAGLPAKKIGERNKELRYIFDGNASAFY